MKNGKILVAEDNQLNKDTLTEILTEEGYDVKAVNDGREGIEAFHQDKYDIIITDLRMPRVDGLEFLKYVKDQNRDSIVIMITGHGTISTAVSAMKTGAFDFITKPVKDELVKLSVSRAMSFARLRDENVSLKEHIKEQQDAAISRSSRSIAAPSPKIFWRANFSATRKALSPARSATGWAASNWPRGARSFWMKSAI